MSMGTTLLCQSYKYKVKFSFFPFRECSSSFIVQPYITTDPSTQNILVNNNVTFTCCATGQPTPMIYWLKNNQTVDFTVNTKFTADSEASGNQICSHLRITGANFTNRGDYRCQAVNLLATRLSAISQISELTVLCKLHL